MRAHFAFFVFAAFGALACAAAPRVYRPDSGQFEMPVAQNWIIEREKSAENPSLSDGKGEGAFRAECFFFPTQEALYPFAQEQLKDMAHLRQKGGEVFTTRQNRRALRALCLLQSAGQNYAQLFYFVEGGGNGHYVFIVVCAQSALERVQKEWNDAILHLRFTEGEKNAARAPSIVGQIAAAAQKRPDVHAHLRSKHVLQAAA